MLPVGLVCVLSLARLLGRSRRTAEADAWALPLTQEAGWEVWNWQGPLGAGTAHTCSWTPLLPPATRGLPSPTNASICLRSADDLLCNAVRQYGHWPECADLPELYHHTAQGGGLVVDAGANIGSCSLHMLLATDAQIASFEPGAENLFYASSSLLRLVPLLEGVRHRLQLYPLALGSANHTELLHAAVGNAGHSVVGQRPTQYAPQGHEQPQSILVRQLDDVLWPASQRSQPPPAIALLKLDVEGYECKALQGMQQLLGVHAIRVIKVEVFEYSLRAQGCSAVELQRMLDRAGFHLYVKPPRGMDGQAPHSPDVVFSSAPYNLYGTVDLPGPGPTSPWARRHPDGIAWWRSLHSSGGAHRRRTSAHRNRSWYV